MPAKGLAGSHTSRPLDKSVKPISILYVTNELSFQDEGTFIMNVSSPHENRGERRAATTKYLSLKVKPDMMAPGLPLSALLAYQAGDASLVFAGKDEFNRSPSRQGLPSQINSALWWELNKARESSASGI